MCTGDTRRRVHLFCWISKKNCLFGSNVHCVYMYFIPSNINYGLRYDALYNIMYIIYFDKIYLFFFCLRKTFNLFSHTCLYLFTLGESGPNNLLHTCNIFINLHTFCTYIYIYIRNIGRRRPR